MAHSRRAAVLPAIISLFILILAASCDLLLGINSFTVKIDNHSTNDVKIWWSGMEESEAKLVPANTVSEVFDVRTEVWPVNFVFYSKVGSSPRHDLQFSIGDGWNYTLGFYNVGSVWDLVMDDEVR